MASTPAFHAFSVSDGELIIASMGISEVSESALKFAAISKRLDSGVMNPSIRRSISTGKTFSDVNIPFFPEAFIISALSPERYDFISLLFSLSASATTINGLDDFSPPSACSFPEVFSDAGRNPCRVFIKVLVLWVW